MSDEELKQLPRYRRKGERRSMVLNVARGAIEYLT
jgi:hypothetical protein